MVDSLGQSVPVLRFIHFFLFLCFLYRAMLKLLWYCLVLLLLVVSYPISAPSEIPPSFSVALNRSVIYSMTDVKDFEPHAPQHCSSFQTEYRVSTPVEVSEPQPPRHCSSFKTDDSGGSPVEDKRFDAFPRLAQLQMRWDRTMCMELGLPGSYTEVGVLLVKWRPGIDELKTTEEVIMLQAVFKDGFGFKTQVFDISERCTCSRSQCPCTPRERLQRRIKKFMRRYDSSNSLSIIYYTGHGSRYAEPRPGLLMLHP